MPKLKTKDLVTTTPKMLTASDFDHVNVVAGGPETDPEKFWYLLGRHEVLTFDAALAVAAWAEGLQRIKKSKLYLLQEKDWDTWCQKRAGFSRPTIDQTIKIWSEFGKFGIVAEQLLHISHSQLRALNPSFDADGNIHIGTKKFSLRDKSSVAAAELAVKELFDERNRAVEKNGEDEKAKANLKTDLDNAKKAAEKLRQQLRDRERAAQLAFEHADPDWALMIKIEQDLDFLLEQLTSCVSRNLSPTNQNRLVALAELVWARAHQATERVRSKYGIGLLAARPGESAEVDELTPNKRSLADEYFEQHPLKK